VKTTSDYFFLGCLSFFCCFFSCKSSLKENGQPPTTEYYTEKYRPQYHFTPEAKWMNDPNGMVYYDGEYHLFYQYYPDSTVWGPMHWGHAVSKDLVYWEHLPVALYPDSLGYIFSGSAVVDKGNTSGLGKDGKDPMVAIFTHHHIEGEKAGRVDFQYQSLAYSNDKGRTFTKFDGNPVVKNPGIKDFRDPKVFWYDQNKQWVMVLAAYDKALFYMSPDLKNWTQTGTFGIPGDKRLWECPDLFPIRIEGTQEQKWVLIASIQQQAPNGGTATAYFVGDFDGKTFTGDNKNQKWLDYGTDNYAMVTWSGSPDKRILSIGWMSNWQYAQQVPTLKWRSAMTLPRELKLFKQDNDYMLHSLPVDELSAIESKTTTIGSHNLKENPFVTDISGTSKFDFSFEKPDSGVVNIRFSNTNGEYLDVGYDANTKSYFVDRTFAGKSDFNQDFARKHYGRTGYKHDSVDMLIYLDHASVELFADGGQCVMTDIFFPSVPFTHMYISGNVILKRGSSSTLKRIW